MAHTPGPWHISTKLATDYGAVIRGGPGPDGPYIARMGENLREGDANAALIAAAPDLLHSLREILTYFGNPKVEEWMSTDAWKGAVAIEQRARAAISKAESV